MCDTPCNGCLAGGLQRASALQGGSSFTSVEPARPVDWSEQPLLDMGAGLIYTLCCITFVFMLIFLPKSCTEHVPDMMALQHRVGCGVVVVMGCGLLMCVLLCS